MFPKEGFGDLTQVDVSDLRVERTTSIYHALSAFCIYNSAVLPFGLRAGATFVPAGAEYEKRFDDEGHTYFRFFWHKNGEAQRAELSLMDSGDCDIMLPIPESFGPAQISLDEFNSLSSRPFRDPLASTVMQELEWYRSRVTTVSGLVGRDKSDGTFAAILFGPDREGVLGGIRFKVSIPTQAEARAALLLLIEEQEATGERVFCHD